MKHNLENIIPIHKQNINYRTQKHDSQPNFKLEFQIKKVFDIKKTKFTEHFGILEQKETNRYYKSKMHSKRQDQTKKLTDLNIKIAVNKIKLQNRNKKPQDKVNDKSEIQMLKKEIEYLQSDSDGQQQKSVPKNNTKFPKRQEIFPSSEAPFEDVERLSNNFFFSKQKMSVILQNRRRIKKLKSFSFPNERRNLNTLNKQICLKDIFINTRPYSSSINDDSCREVNKQSNVLNFTNYIENYAPRKNQNSRFLYQRANMKNKVNNKDDLTTTFYSTEIRSQSHKHNTRNEHYTKSRDTCPKIL